VNQQLMQANVLERRLVQREANKWESYEPLPAAGCIEMESRTHEKQAVGMRRTNWSMFGKHPKTGLKDMH
jgi:hypothetical protein